MDLFSFIAICLTAIYVRKYWEEAQRTKEEIITQNRINFQTVKVSLLPLVFVELEKYPYHEAPYKPIYDLYLHNVGNGPAFRIIFQRKINREKNSQKIIAHGSSGESLRTQFLKVDFLNKNERKKIFTEKSDSYQYMVLKIIYSDIAGDWHTVRFEGDRDKIELKEYPKLLSFYDRKGFPMPDISSQTGSRESSD